LTELNQNKNTYLSLSDRYGCMFKNRVIDIITSLVLLVFALVVVDLTVLEFDLILAVTNVFNGVVTIIALTVAALLLLRRA